MAKKKQPLKDPKGGLTAAGRAHFKKKEGADLKPGVKGKADTPEKQRVGLGVRESMEEGEAMLFPFATESRHPFWMNGMKFPIDIIWLDADKRVVHIEHNLQPCPNIVDCPNYAPDEDALYVLETVAGFSERHGVVEGTQAEFDLG